MKVEDYVGPETLKRMRQTKWYMLAHFLGELLYAGGDVHAEGSVGSDLGYTNLRRPTEGDADYARKFITPARVYMGDSFPEHLKFLGRDGKYCDVAKTLRELAHECERMALKEVT